MPLKVLEGSKEGSQQYQGKAQVVGGVVLGIATVPPLSCAGRLTGEGNPSGNDRRAVVVSFRANPSRTGERDSG